MAYRTIKTTKYVTRNGRRVKITSTKKVYTSGSSSKKTPTKKKSSLIRANDMKNEKYDAKGRKTGSTVETTASKNYMYKKYNPSKIINEAKTKGLAYVADKYKGPVFDKMKDRLETIMKNAAPKAKAGFKAAYGRQRDGGPNDNPNAIFNRQMNFNLSNDEDLAQGSEHPWAQPTAISHLISGQLRQAANTSVDYMQTWAQDKTGAVDLQRRNGSLFGIEATFHDGIQGQAEKLALNNPMGAFGTNAVMEDYGQQEYYAEEQAEESNDLGYFDGWNEWTGYYDGDGRFVNVASGMSADEYKNRYGGFYAAISDKDRQEWMATDPQGFKKAMADAKAAEMKAINDFAKKFPNSNAVMKDSGAHNAYNQSYKSSYAAFYNKQAGKDLMNADGTWKPAPAPAPGTNAPYEPTKDEGYKPTPLPNYEVGGAHTTPGDDAIYGERPDGVYNPWSRLEGGQTYSQGPNPNTLAHGQMEAMALANAYFAPQRAELAYELGDMETDMRRLAVNLGRQVDDPVLQAKLYKEANRAVRTLDIQQNTFAFQMAESRRKEDIANWQFYDQLAAQEAQLKLANRQFYEKLELDKRNYNLNNWIAQQNANTLSNIPAPTGENPAQAQEDSDYGNLLGAYKTF